MEVMFDSSKVYFISESIRLFDEKFIKPNKVNIAKKSKFDKVVSIILLILISFFTYFTRMQFEDSLLYKAEDIMISIISIVSISSVFYTLKYGNLLNKKVLNNGK